ncbi:MAG TPA: hypothetical protein VI112_10585 [Bacteroidia bacterium]
MYPALTSMLIGALIGAVNGTSIFFVREEPYKLAIFTATIFRNSFVGLLTWFTLHATTPWWMALASGTVYGTLLGGAVMLAQGKFRNRQHLVILPFSALTGAAIGLVLWKTFY